MVHRFKKRGTTDCANVHCEVTYEHENDLEDGASLVSPPVGVAEECAEEREHVDSAHPYADIICCIGVVLPKDPG